MPTTGIDIEAGLPRYPRYGGLLWGVTWPANATYTADQRAAVTEKLLAQIGKKWLPVFEEANSTWVFTTSNLNTDSQNDGRFSDRAPVRSDVTRSDIIGAMMRAGDCHPAISYNAANQPYVLSAARRSDLYTEFLTLANANDWWLQRASTHTQDTTGSNKYADFSNPNCARAYVDLVVKHQRRMGFSFQFFDELHNYPYRLSDLEIYNGSTTTRTTSGINLAQGGTWQTVMEEFLRLYKIAGGLPCIVNGEYPSTTVGPANGRMWQKWNVSSTSISTLVSQASAFWRTSDIGSRLCMAQTQWVNASSSPQNAPPVTVNQAAGADIFSREDLAAGDRADTVNNSGRNQNLNYNSADSWNGSAWSGSDPTWTTGTNGTVDFPKMCRFNAAVNALIDGISNVDGDAPFSWPWQYTPWEPGAFGVPVEYLPYYGFTQPRLRKIGNGDRYVWVRYFTNGVLVVNESSATFTDDGTVLLGRSLGATIVSLAARTTLGPASQVCGDAAFFPTRLYSLPL